MRSNRLNPRLPLPARREGAWLVAAAAVRSRRVRRCRRRGDRGRCSPRRNRSRRSLDWIALPRSAVVRRGDASTAVLSQASEETLAVEVRSRSAGERRVVDDLRDGIERRRRIRPTQLRAGERRASRRASAPRARIVTYVDGSSARGETMGSREREVTVDPARRGARVSGVRAVAQASRWMRRGRQERARTCAGRATEGEATSVRVAA